MTPSPFARLNVMTLRAERAARIEAIGRTLAALILAGALCALGAFALQAALSIPEIAARAAAQARW